VYEDASFGTPEKAAKADRSCSREDLRGVSRTCASRPELQDREDHRRESAAGEFSGDIACCSTTMKDGSISKGFSPTDDYKSGEKRPMIVSFYEKNSQNMPPATRRRPSSLEWGSLPMEAVTKGLHNHDECPTCSSTPVVA